MSLLLGIPAFQNLSVSAFQRFRLPLFCPVAVQIYVNKNQQQLGPYSADEARSRMLSGELAGSDLAWHAGLPSWVTLAEVLGSYSAHPSLGPIAPAQPAPAPRLSGFGIVSLVAGIIGAIGWVIVLIFAVVAEQHGHSKDNNDPVLMVLGLLFLGALAINILGAVTGIVALVKGTSHKWVAMTGLISNAVEFFGIIVLAIIGTAMK